ncbi:uncharacterized protein MYCFIDRAFT_174558 [Pseudocercospora fijiensis CIRAD86]|uniref:Uncharacterized protein n=1 Tax=Pseudocercospora fijiensis (strain CIRAD86) TaxID=383855 RepID=M2YZM5_PSEFD|nr:uncharacterized protein MYCFIDRAFT_174558 [Pseudocercospora fijiensis CIRAD86]EME83080.1 hypothetical protein MYCFIDRAFT_174558 [Pseudocercospora fijiensis CIRAD86]
MRPGSSTGTIILGHGHAFITLGLSGMQSSSVDVVAFGMYDKHVACCYARIVAHDAYAGRDVWKTVIGKHKWNQRCRIVGIMQTAVWAQAHGRCIIAAAPWRRLGRFGRSGLAA